MGLLATTNLESEDEAALGIDSAWSHGARFATRVSRAHCSSQLCLSGPLLIAGDERRLLVPRNVDSPDGHKDQYIFVFHGGDECTHDLRPVSGAAGIYQAFPALQLHYNIISVMLTIATFSRH